MGDSIIMIEVLHKIDCCGCEACVQICPVPCINLSSDEEGFFYPKVDLDKCVDCEMCVDVCPVIHPREPVVPLAKYAAMNLNEPIRLESSSGGMFHALAQKVIEQGGVVFGARFAEDWSVVHDYTETLEGIKAFMGSKYVQSKINKSFIVAEKFLKEGRLVLFTATHCQIAGLRNFLGRDYENLLSVDIICHGVPSEKIWKKYLTEVAPSEKVTSVQFRSKKEEGWGRYHINIDTETRHHSSLYKENPYQKALIQNLSLRPSCARCCAKNGNSGSDLLLGDYWGVRQMFPEMDDDKGTSVVVAFTAKGLDFFNSLHLRYQIIEMKEGERIKLNSVIMHLNRDRFFSSEDSIQETVEELCKESFIVRIKSGIVELLLKLIGFNTRQRIKRFIHLK